MMRMFQVLPVGSGNDVREVGLQPVDLVPYGRGEGPMRLVPLREVAAAACAQDSQLHDLAAGTQPGKWEFLVVSAHCVAGGLANCICQDVLMFVSPCAIHDVRGLGSRIGQTGVRENAACVFAAQPCGRRPTRATGRPRRRRRSRRSRRHRDRPAHPPALPSAARSQRVRRRRAEPRRRRFR